MNEANIYDKPIVAVCFNEGQFQETGEWISSDGYFVELQ
jgi:hypothetical protein